MKRARLLTFVAAVTLVLGVIWAESLRGDPARAGRETRTAYIQDTD